MWTGQHGRVEVSGLVAAIVEAAPTPMDSNAPGRADKLYEKRVLRPCEEVVSRTGDAAGSNVEVKYPRLSR